MKKTKAAILYAGSIIASWLVFSILWAFIGNASYTETLRHPGQIMGLIAIYSWFPGLFLMEDMENKAKN